jgi:hypothetical protein
VALFFLPAVRIIPHFFTLHSFYFENQSSQWIPMPECRSTLFLSLTGFLFTWFATCGLHFAGAGLAGGGYLMAGLVISALLLKAPEVRLAIGFGVAGSRWKLLALATGLMFSYHLARQVMDRFPLRYEDADMLPVMRVMGARFLSGDWRSIYDVIPEIWNGMQPVYLPFMWLPFSLAEPGGFDIRWVTFSGIWLAVLLPFMFLEKLGTVSEWLILSSILVLLWWFHMEPTNNVIKLTEEGVVYAYYVLLAVALASGNPLLIGLSVSVCLLSRYSFAGALPAVGCYWLWRGRWRRIMTVLAVVTAFIISSLLIFGPRVFLPFTELPVRYVEHAAKVWIENPEYFLNGLGLAKYFGPANIGLQYGLLVYGSFLLPFLWVLASIFYEWKSGKRLRNVELSLVLVTLTYFHSMLVVSYLYLFYTPVVFGLAAVSLAFHSRRMTIR